MSADKLALLTLAESVTIGSKDKSVKGSFPFLALPVQWCGSKIQGYPGLPAWTWGAPSCWWSFLPWSWHWTSTRQTGRGRSGHSRQFWHRGREDWSTWNPQTRNNRTCPSSHPFNFQNVVKPASRENSNDLELMKLEVLRQWISWYIKKGWEPR